VRLADAVIEVARTTACDVLIPCNDSTLGFVAAHEARLRAALRVEAPRAEVIRRVLDKDETLRIAEQCGIVVPGSYPVRDRETLGRLAGQIRYPVVVKPTRKSAEAAFKVRYYADHASLDAEFERDPRFGEHHLVQEFCAGDGVGIGVLVRSGRPVAMLQHRRLKEHPWSGGVSVTATTEPVDPELAERSLRLLRALEWDGVAMVEWKHDRTTGSAVLMEVNGRFWGSHALAVAAGLDLPGLLVDHAEAPATPYEARPGVVFHWLAGDLQRVVQLVRSGENGLPRPGVLAAAGSALADLVRRGDRSLWSASDPRPVVHELLRVSRRLAVDGVKSLLRPVVPDRAMAHVRRWRRLERPARRVYARRLATRSLDRASRTRVIGPDVRSVVFVCHGNIMRSAFAAALLRQELGGGDAVRVVSAGMRAKAGRPADPRAVAAAAELGVSLGDHRAQPMSATLVRESDLIVVMDALNESELLAAFPEARGKVLLAGELAGSPDRSALEIADPYTGTGDDVRGCFRRVAEHVRWLHGRIAVASSSRA
jgi:protein-tyrosine-phosphatase/predicted ATP-grasp superfamily ATP-dependent carboligase